MFSRRDGKVAMIQGVPLAEAPEEGSAYFAVALVSGLRKLGLDVVIWTKRRAEKLERQSVPVEARWAPGYGAWLDLIIAIGREKPAIVHLQYSMFCLGPKASGEFSTLLFVIGAKLIGARLVVTCHDVPAIDRITTDFIRANRYRFPVFVVKAGLRTIFFCVGLFADQLIVHHEWLGRTLIDDYGVSPKKVTTIPLAQIGFEANDRATARRLLGIDPAARTILYFGFATGYKGIDELLDAMDFLLQRGDPIKLILGAGYHPKKDDNLEYRAYYEALRERVTSMPNVDFVGFIASEDLDRYVAAVDACIFPYIEFQGMSGPLLQAAAQLRPLLVSSVIAKSLGQFERSSFTPNAENIAAYATKFFFDPAFHAVVVDESVRFESTVVSDDAAERTAEVYRSLVGA